MPAKLTMKPWCIVAAGRERQPRLGAVGFAGQVSRRSRLSLAAHRQQPRCRYSRGSGNREDADLIAHLAAQGKVRMHLILTSQTAEEVSTFNVVGDLKGSEHPEQVVIVSGHLDSWDLGTGAIDDAAGVAVAMETAQLIQQLHLHPKRTLRVIAWMDEENLGRGHAEYAKAHAAEIGNHVAALESDLGASHPMGFRAKITPEAAARAAAGAGCSPAFRSQPDCAKQR